MRQNLYELLYTSLNPPVKRRACNLHSSSAFPRPLSLIPIVPCTYPTPIEGKCLKSSGTSRISSPTAHSTLMNRHVSRGRGDHQRWAILADAASLPYNA
jgi:hypothetical protein